MKRKQIDMRGNDPGGNSPFPEHHFPNIAPETYFLIGSGRILMKGDLCWDISTGLWKPIYKEDIGRSDTRYYRLARPMSNTQVNIAKRSKIKWNPMSTANKHCVPLILKLKNGNIVQGRTQSIGPAYKTQGWFKDTVNRVGEYETTHQRVYPVAWAQLPEDVDSE